MRRAIAYLTRQQRPEGCIAGEVVWSPIISAQYVLVCHIMSRDIPADRRRLNEIGSPALSPVGDAGAGPHQHRLEAERSAADDQAGDHEEDAVEDSHEPEELRDDDQDPDRQHGVGEECRRPGPAR